MGVGTYQPDKVRAAFHRLSQGGYNSVRIFFDLCAKGPSCIGNPDGKGLNPVYLDHMVEIMHIAAEEKVFLLFTANSIPLNGQYWDRFVQQFNNYAHEGFVAFHENGNYLHAAGVAMHAQYWRDLMSGLAQHEAPFEVMLGWELQNEYWLFNDKPPLSLDSGLVSISNGESYDMSDPEQKRQMVADGVLYWMDALIAVIKEYDPDALVTIGFFPPNFPNDLKAAPEWYRDTAPLLDTAPVDFWDFHAYPPAEQYIIESMENVSENFGIIGYTAKPVLIGEVGAFRWLFPNLEIGTRSMQEWMIESCKFGFDGWLTWEYLNRPAPDAVWGLENDILFDALSPANSPDGCAMTLVPLSNLAYQKAATASRALPESPPENAVDGSGLAWNAGGGAPQWIQIDLGASATITEIRLQVAQYPEGDTVHSIRVLDASGDYAEAFRFSQYTKSEDWLIFKPETPLAEVQVIRIYTLDSPSWVSWMEIEVYGEIK